MHATFTVPACMKSEERFSATENSCHSETGSRVLSDIDAKERAYCRLPYAITATSPTESIVHILQCTLLALCQRVWRKKGNFQRRKNCCSSGTKSRALSVTDTIEKAYWRLLYATTATSLTESIVHILQCTLLACWQMETVSEMSLWWRTEGDSTPFPQHQWSTARDFRFQNGSDLPSLTVALYLPCTLNALRYMDGRLDQFSPSPMQPETVSEMWLWWRIKGESTRFQ